MDASTSIQWFTAAEESFFESDVAFLPVERRQVSGLRVNRSRHSSRRMAAGFALLCLAMVGPGDQGGAKSTDASSFSPSAMVELAEHPAPITIAIPDPPEPAPPPWDGPTVSNRIVERWIDAAARSVNRMLAAVDPDRGKAMGAFRLVTDGTSKNRGAKLAYAAFKQRWFARRVLGRMDKKVIAAQKQCQAKLAAVYRKILAGHVGPMPAELAAARAHQLRRIARRFETIHQEFRDVKTRLDKRAEAVSYDVGAFWARLQYYQRALPKKFGETDSQRAYRIFLVASNKGGKDKGLVAASIRREISSVKVRGPAKSCQGALSHLIRLTLKATGKGPTDKDRGEFLSRCEKSRSRRAIRCVLRLTRLSRDADMRPIWRCLWLR